MIHKLVNISLTLLLTIYCSLLFAARTITVNNEGELLYPNKETFINKNLKRNFYIYIDLLDTEYTDCELKVYENSTGKLLYFTATYKLNNKTHNADVIIDKNIEVYYQSEETSDSACYGIKTKFLDYKTSSIDVVSANYKISGIWIYPDLSNNEIRAIFENPDNTIIIWRVNNFTAESVNGKKQWRIVTPTYYGPPIN